MTNKNKILKMFRPRCINKVATTNTAIMQFSTIFWPENTAVLSNAQLCGIQPDPQEMVDVLIPVPVGVAPGTVGADVLLLLGVGGRVALQLAQVLVALPARLARKVVQLPNLKN